MGPESSPVGRTKVLLHVRWGIMDHSYYQSPPTWWSYKMRTETHTSLTVTATGNKFKSDRRDRTEVLTHHANLPPWRLSDLQW